MICAGLRRIEIACETIIINFVWNMRMVSHRCKLAPLALCPWKSSCHSHSHRRHGNEKHSNVVCLLACYACVGNDRGMANHHRRLFTATMKTVQDHIGPQMSCPFAQAQFIDLAPSRCYANSLPSFMLRHDTCANCQPACRNGTTKIDRQPLRAFA